MPASNHEPPEDMLPNVGARGSISFRYAWRILQTARELGASPEDICREAGLLIPPAPSPELWIPVTQHLDLWESAHAAVGRRDFPLLVAEAMGAETDDLVAFSCMTSERLLPALQNLARYMPVATNWAHWEFDGDDAAWQLAYVNPGEKRPALRCSAEFALGCVVALGRRYTGVEWAPRQVHFAHEPPDDVRHLEAFFGAPVTFGGGRHALTIDMAVLNLPMAKADRALCAFFDKQAAQILANQDKSAVDVDLALERVLVELLKDGNPTLEAAARKLATSSRTLRRRLLERGTTFQQQLDRLRLSLAGRYLSEERRSIGEIAYLLGFSDTAAFYRAYRRWTGSTPRARDAKR